MSRTYLTLHPAEGRDVMPFDVDSGLFLALLMTLSVMSEAVNNKVTPDTDDYLFLKVNSHPITLFLMVNFHPIALSYGEL